MEPRANCDSVRPHGIKGLLWHSRAAWNQGAIVTPRNFMEPAIYCDTARPHWIKGTIVDSMETHRTKMSVSC